MKRIVSAVLSSLLAAAAAGVAAQEGATPGRMVELNRTGRWSQAAEMAEQYLKESAGRPLEARCHARGNLAYSRLRLGEAESARAALARFDEECRALPPGHWVHDFADEVRKGLGDPAPPSAARPRPSPVTPRASSGAARPAPAPAARREDDFWRTADPAAAGVDPSALEEHRRLCERTGADACLVVRGGRLVQEFYSGRYSEPMYAMSSTKSVTGLLVGMLLDDGRIKSLDEPVCSYVAEWCGGRKGKVTLRHLLSMTSGLPRMWGEGIASTNDKNRFVAALAPAAEPGAAWAYSNEGVQLLSPVLDKAAGEPIQDYARRRLFEPLGMTGTRLHLDERGHAWTYADMETSARDMARLGLLMLNRGVWRGRRIVSASWVEQSTRRSQQFERYGLLWWLYDEPKGFAAIGHLNTNIYVFPGLDLVVVRMQSKPLERELPYEPEALRLFARMVRRR